MVCAQNLRTAPSDDIAPEDLGALEEILAILRDAAPMNRLAESDAESARGEYVSAEELAETMRRRQALWATSPQRISTSCERPPRFAVPWASYRIICRIDEKNRVVTVVDVDHRCDVYRP